MTKAARGHGRRDQGVHRAILAAWRIEQPRLITCLARMLRDVPLAEELTQDALVAARSDGGKPAFPIVRAPADDHRQAPRARSPRRAPTCPPASGDRGGARRRAERHAGSHLDGGRDEDFGNEMLRLIFRPAILCSRPTRASRWRGASSAGSTGESPVAFLQSEAPSRSHRARRGLSSESALPTRRRAARSARGACRRCWRRST